MNGVFSVPSSAPDYSSTLTLTIPSNSPTGSFTLTITGSGGGITRIANVILIVNPRRRKLKLQPKRKHSNRSDTDSCPRRRVRHVTAEQPTHNRRTRHPSNPVRRIRYERPRPTPCAATDRTPKPITAPNAEQRTPPGTSSAQTADKD